MEQEIPGFQFDDEKGQKRSEEKISDLQKIAGPTLCGVIVQEGGPVLSTRSFEANVLPILLDGPFDFSAYPA